MTPSSRTDRARAAAAIGSLTLATTLVLASTVGDLAQVTEAQAVDAETVAVDGTISWSDGGFARTVSNSLTNHADPASPDNATIVHNDATNTADPLVEGRAGTWGDAAAGDTAAGDEALGGTPGEATFEVRTLGDRPGTAVNYCLQAALPGTTADAHDECLPDGPEYSHEAQSRAKSWGRSGGVASTPPGSDQPSVFVEAENVRTMVECSPTGETWALVPEAHSPFGGRGVGVAAVPAGSPEVPLLAAFTAVEPEPNSRVTAWVPLSGDIPTSTVPVATAAPMIPAEIHTPSAIIPPALARPAEPETLAAPGPLTDLESPADTAPAEVLPVDATPVDAATVPAADEAAQSDTTTEATGATETAPTTNAINEATDTPTFARVSVTSRAHAVEGYALSDLYATVDRYDASRQYAGSFTVVFARSECGVKLGAVDHLPLVADFPAPDAPAYPADPGTEPVTVTAAPTPDTAGVETVRSTRVSTRMSLVDDSRDAPAPSATVASRESRGQTGTSTSARPSDTRATTSVPESSGASEMSTAASLQVTGTSTRRTTTTTTTSASRTSTRVTPTPGTATSVPSSVPPTRVPELSQSSPTNPAYPTSSPKPSTRPSPSTTSTPPAVTTVRPPSLPTSAPAPTQTSTHSPADDTVDEPKRLRATAKTELAGTVTVRDEDCLVVVVGTDLPSDTRYGLAALEDWLDGGDPGDTWVTFVSDDPDGDGWRWAAVSRRTGTTLYVP